MFTRTFPFTAGRTDIYAYPASASYAFSSTPWTTHRELATELVTGLYSVTVDETKSHDWSVFDGATVPTTHDDAIVFLRYAEELDAAGVRAAIGLASANLDTQLADLPTVSEFNARSLPSADYFVVSDYTAPANSDIVAIKAVTEKLNTAMVLDGAVYQFTTNALENAPAGGSGLDAAGVRAALGLASANLDTQLADLPTVSELNARTLPSADYFVVSDYTAPDATKLVDVWRRLGLDPANPLVNTATLISAGSTLQIDVTQTSTTVTTTRQA